MNELTGELSSPIDLSKRKIGICYPSPEMTDYRFNECLMQMITQTSRFVSLGLSNAVSSRVAVNRNTLVENARILGATDILFIDADSRFPVNSLMRLLLMEKDIACATTCRRKGNDRSPVAIPKDRDSITSHQKVVPMIQVGLPFMLIKMAVFDKLDELGIAPDNTYFAEPPRWVMRKLGWELAGEDGLVGEDEYFCQLVHKAGFDIWCDMELTMEIGHIGSTVFYVENAQPPEARVDEKL